jgi:hypothetical protein
MRWERAAAGGLARGMLLAVAVGTAAVPAWASEDPDVVVLRRQADQLLNAVRQRVADCAAGPRLVAVLEGTGTGPTDASTGTERPPLRWNDRLAEAAARHAGAMARSRIFAHVGSDGTTVRERVDAAGYRWQSVAENLAAGQSELHEAVADWLASVSHCAALTDGRFTEFGLARTVAEHPHDAYGTYWALVLGRPR